MCPSGSDLNECTQTLSPSCPLGFKSLECSCNQGFLRLTGVRFCFHFCAFSLILFPLFLPSNATAHCPISQASLHSDTAWPGRGDDAAPSPPTPVSAARDMCLPLFLPLHFLSFYFRFPLKQRWQRRCHCHSGNLNAMAMTTTATMEWHKQPPRVFPRAVIRARHVDQVRFSSLFSAGSHPISPPFLSSFLQMMIFDIYMTVYFYVPCNA
ncbi:hypothetical protein F5148DRAFT_784368 [Russula earlei]|uniref:Uncharacterized protein n=1 Tax=Russula earlei TaxID=71964 RepID=A0ACC0TSN4_9AGAM|nr:hypothetical protein F5148DRAFT_784368 [Russula earlei]